MLRREANRDLTNRHRVAWEVDRRGESSEQESCDSAVLDAERFAAGQNERQVHVTVRVAVGHAAAVQSRRRVEQRTGGVANLAEPIEKIVELFDVERVAGREVRRHVLVAVMMSAHGGRS